MIDDDDDWTEIEKATTQSARKPDAQIGLTFKANRRGKSTRATATIWLRREAAEWIDAHGPRFRVQVGGSACNLVRLIPDNERGQFEAGELKGVKRLIIGHINLWPNEARDATDAKWRADGGGMVLTLPADFAKAGRSVAPPAPPPPPPPKPAGPPPAFPITTAAPGLRRVVPAPGEPPPGRSALSQRK